VQEQVQGRTDHDDVANGAQPGLLPHRDPQEQDHRADYDRPLLDGEPEVLGQALVQDVPRHDAEPGLNDQGFSEGKGDQPGIQLDEPPRHPATVEVTHAWGPTAPDSRTRSEG